MITSGGSVYASTRSGTNQYHGQLFYLFQDYRALFAAVKGTEPPFQRNQFGGSVGGPIFRDKLFFFADVERIKQDSSVPTTVDDGAVGSGATAVDTSSIFNAYPTIPTPSRDTYLAGRLDYNGPWGMHMFARINYEANGYVTGIDYATYSNRDNVPGIAGGVDLAKGRFTHSFRGSFEKFHNFIIPDVNPKSTFDPFPGIYLSYGAVNLRTGLNDNAPQNTFQEDRQLRYDGSFLKGRHNIRYGASLNRILGGGAAAFFGSGPGVYLSNTSSSLFVGPTAKNPNGLGCGGVAGAAPCPDDFSNGYHPRYFYLGNDLGVYTEKPAFGLPGGGQGDWRTGFYVNDAWKVTPSFTLSIGARYDRDTGRTDSDLGVIPCSAIVVSSFPGGVPCTGSAPLLDQFAPGMGGRVAQPNKNVAPQIGFNYAPAALHNRTAFRGGFGIFYESSVFNNNLFERNARLATGKFNQYNLMCPSVGGASSLFLPGTGAVTANSAGVPIYSTTVPSMCTEPMSKAVGDILTLENDFKSAAAATAGPNPAFIGNVLYASASSGTQLFAPDYKSPYSINWNFGVQQELKTGMVLSIDYVHNAGLRIGQSHDVNHVGDARYFNLTAAQNAVLLALGDYPTCPQSYSRAAIDCAISNGATIGEFAQYGLDSLATLTGGAPIQSGAYPYTTSLTPNGGAAFPGANPNVGVGSFQFPDGKSAYDGLQFNFKEQKANPLPGLAESTLEVSYAYSRFITSASGGSSDQFFLASAYDNNNPSGYMGYGSLDRTHILSFGGSFTVKRGPHIGIIGHFDSAPPTTLTLDTSGNDGSGLGEIFQTDLTGDGTTGDFLPGTEQGYYSRKIKPNTLNQAITNYNGTSANQLTPAGHTLVNSGLFTAQEMLQIGAVTPTLGPAPSYAFPNPTLRQMDAVITYPIGHGIVHFLPESVSIEPGISFFNVFNFANYSAFLGPSGQLLIDSSGAGSLNSPYNQGIRDAARTTRGIGTFAEGAPRTTEFDLKLNF